ncbi:MAG TPA: hypothetical protein VKQ32_08065 [Polyangia bacterium]|nr:hypothetical protein [Polyangia bacterium]
MRPWLRIPLLATVVAVPLLAAAPAAAQIPDAGPTNATWASGDFFIGVQHQAGANLSDFDRARFFNKAHCDCTETVYVYIALTDSGFAKRTLVDQSGNIEFFVGSQCDSNDSGRPLRCKSLKAEPLAAFLVAGRDTVQTTARVLSTFTQSTFLDGGAITGTFAETSDCTSPTGQSFPQTIFVITYDKVTGAPQAIATSQLNIDLTPPPAPSSLGDVTVEPGNEAVVITWPKVDSSVVTDLLGYQVLCNRAGSLQVFNDGTFGAGFLECAMPGGDAGVGNGDNDGGVSGLDPRYICSPLLSTTTSSFRVKILQNDIPYGVSVVSIDTSGNASPPDLFYATPIKTKSFYDVYRNDDPNNPGAASGGLCTLGERTSTRGAATGITAALVIAGIVVVARRRRRR